MLLYPFSLPPVAELNTAQMDGRECVYCPGESDGAMRPVGRLFGGQLFAHTECAEENRIEEEKLR
jgi:hypothetical protein